MIISPAKYRLIILLLFLGGASLSFFPATGIAASSSTDDDQAYRLLDWKDLVSPTWEPPLIQPAPDENGQIEIDPASLVSSLDKLAVKLPGYMVPIKFTNNEVSEFLLVPFLKHHVTQHVSHEANQMVYVSLRDALPVSNPYEPFWVEGLIMLESVETLDGGTGYHIIGARAYVYEY